jgi:hypothetical protein
MTANARSKTELDAAKDTADLQQAVESLVEARPDLADPEKRRRFEEVLNKHIANRIFMRELAGKQPRDEIAKSEIDQARRFTSFATTVSGAVSAGLIAALIAPRAPEFAIAGVALIGLVGSKFVARSLDRLMDKGEQNGSRSSI